MIEEKVNKAEDGARKKVGHGSWEPEGRVYRAVSRERPPFGDPEAQKTKNPRYEYSPPFCGWRDTAQAQAHQPCHRASGSRRVSK